MLAGRGEFAEKLLLDLGLVRVEDGLELLGQLAVHLHALVPVFLLEFLELVGLEGEEAHGMRTVLRDLRAAVLELLDADQHVALVGQAHLVEGGPFFQVLPDVVVGHGGEMLELFAHVDLLLAGNLDLPDVGERHGELERMGGLGAGLEDLAVALEIILPRRRDGRLGGGGAAGLGRRGVGARPRRWKREAPAARPQQDPAIRDAPG